VYINLVDVKHKTLPLELRWVDLKDNRVLCAVSLQVEIHLKDPLDPIELAVAMPKLPIPHDGAFALELLTNDDPIGSWRVIATTIEEQDQSE
jgi:hypothetical protein